MFKSKFKVFGISLIVVLLSLSFNASSGDVFVEIDNSEDIVFVCEDLNVRFNQSLSFSQIIIDEEYIGFDNTVFKCESADDVNITIDFINGDVYNGSGEDLVISFYSKQSNDTTFIIEGLNNLKQYVIKKDSSPFDIVSTDLDGCISFEDDAETNAFYEVFVGDPLTQVYAESYEGSSSSFSIDVECIPGEPVKSWECDVYFNASLLNVTSIDWGDIFDGYTIFGSKGTIDNTNGTIDLMYCLIFGPGNVTGSGSLFTINFDVIDDSGDSEITLNGMGITNETAYVSIYVTDSKIIIE